MSAKYKTTVFNNEWAIKERVYFFFCRVMKHKKVIFYEDGISSSTVPLYFLTSGDVSIEVNRLNSGKLKPIKQRHYRNGKVFNILR